MTKIKQIFESMINDLKSTDEVSNYYLTIITYDTKEFYSKYRSVSRIFNKLTNHKSKTMGVSYRDWYKKIKNGFYKAEETPETITLYLGLIPFGELDIIDLENRIINLKPHPIDMTITHNDSNMLNGVFSNLMSRNTYYQVFGKCKKTSKK